MTSTEEQSMRDLSCDENFIVDDLESYWDELNDRLTVFRMVNDSIMRGIVNAISQDAMESISSKDDEISMLKARLHTYESGNITDAKIHLQTLKTGIKAVTCSNSLGTGVDLNMLTKMDDAVDALTILFPNLYSDGEGNTSSLEDAMVERQSQWEFEREILDIVLRDFMKFLQEEQSICLRNQICISDIQIEHRLEKIIGLMGLIQHLDSMKSIHSGVTSEMGSEMTNEKLVAHYSSEWSRIKRQLESLLHEKTDEMFRLKREILNEKGSFWCKRKKFPDLDIEQYFTDERKLRHQKEIPSVNLEKQKQEIFEASEKFFSVVESSLDEQKGRLDGALNELNFLSTELMSTVARLDVVMCQNQEQDAKLRELNHRLVCASNALNEAKRENANLRQAVQHRENEILSAAGRADERGRQMESILKFVHEFSRSVEEFQSCILSRVQVRNCRLEGLYYQIGSLVRAFDAMKSRESRYLKNLEIISSDLQKAEAEVDVLGDEVETLLVILEKIYMALDYYSPVLLHYPGVVETLKLVKRKLKRTHEPAATPIANRISSPSIKGR